MIRGIVAAAGVLASAQAGCASSRAEGPGAVPQALYESGRLVPEATAATAATGATAARAGRAAPEKAGAAQEAETAEGQAPAMVGCLAESAWPLFAHYTSAFVSSDGRVIDHTDHAKSTSEGQAYGLFFALVANDRPLFDRLLSWTEANLAKGALSSRLPAWKWGRDEAGGWRVLDENAASDADLWLAYTLLESSRLWSEPRHGVLARAILAQVVEKEIASLPGLGPMLLPGPVGFEAERDGERRWRLNPSYLPPQLLRRFAAAGVPGPWQGLLSTTERMLRLSAPDGLVADWVLYREGGGFGVDGQTGGVGSYDAIRVYLWFGMLPPGDPMRAALKTGFYDLFRSSGRVPEVVRSASIGSGGHAADAQACPKGGPRCMEGEPGGGMPASAGPPGFVAALLPEARARGDEAAIAALEAQLAAAKVGALYGNPPAYYDQNLILFARGFVEGRYSFAADGRLQPGWEGGCDR